MAAVSLQVCPDAPAGCFHCFACLLTVMSSYVTAPRGRAVVTSNTQWTQLSGSRAG